MKDEHRAHSLLPKPAACTTKSGRLPVDQSLRIDISGHRDELLTKTVERFLNRLAKRTGSIIPVQLPNATVFSQITIECAGPTERVQSVNADEGYALIITSKGARLTAANALGVMRGFETVLQLVDIDDAGFYLPAVDIDDRPRFPWRGLMLDVTRHYMPLIDIKRTLDLMACVKLNVLHLHLTDDQGFNIESRKFPKLHERGHNGAYYTHDDIHAIVDHARDRGIRVVPEFDVPGHTAAWFAAFPHLAGYPGDYTPDRWYGSNPRNKDPQYCPAMDPTLEETCAFLDELFGEMTALFPDQYFHIGGDEVTPHHWLNNPAIVEFMNTHGFAHPPALQAYFNSRLVEIVRKHGKTMIGWDEVLHPDIPKDIAIQSWRGADSLAEAARQGHPAILSNGYYLDLMYSAEAHYSQDPLTGAAANLPPHQQANILGGEACMWSEYVTPEILDDRLWPRLAVIAERFWSNGDVSDIDNLYARFPSILRHLTWDGLKTEPTRSMMFERLTGGSPTDTLRTFAECLEPAKGYARRGYMTTSPLNRLIDTVPPESLAARNFARLCDAPRENAAAIDAHLRRWKSTLPDVTELMTRRALIKPYLPVLDQLATVLDIGLTALAYLDGSAPDGWVDEQTPAIDEAAKDIAEMTIAIVPSIRQLVDTLHSD